MNREETKEAVEVMLDFVETGVTQCRKRAFDNTNWVDSTTPRWDFITYDYRKKRVPQSGYMTFYDDSWGHFFNEETTATLNLNKERNGARIIKWIEVMDDE